MSSRFLVIVASISGLLSVALGAFAAHGLKKILSSYLIGVFETGVTYQFIHTLAILLCALLATIVSNPNSRKAFHRAAICFIIGILFFSGSLYALALTGVKWFGPITPMGGVMFMVGWAFLAYAGYQMTDETTKDGVNQ
ncbi:DUF423 domain-containing protein [Vibrio mediterranei]|uniref:DUF423 domain-containing protein n=1 Tax=Vibrio mediterranei TaxID=689 RepID=UPI001EFD378F|nr:DUF423 domain-containing protein [Vibrio mediterranei]MCG9664421.1 DUF423 domain-containing protein [Vibrio mediterranei]